ncbi:MAG: hypothetical protein ACI8ZM_004721 [Crocinitomix sp.]|jgi:hypothetical protein
MSVIIPELNLTYLEGTNPRHYALNVKVDGQQAQPHLIVNNDNGTMVNPNTQFVISVEMGQASQGSDEIDVDMGQITFDSEESLVEVKLMHNNTLVGEGSIRVKEAQQESKPINGTL